MKVLYAAAISVVVTLAIEWFAKPWLEDRKERITEQRRNLRRLRELADHGFDRVTSLQRMEYKPGHHDRANHALQDFRVELEKLSYGIRDRQREDANNLRKVSTAFAKDKSLEGWEAALEDFFYAFAIFRYGRNEERSFAKMSARDGFVTGGEDPEA